MVRFIPFLLRFFFPLLLIVAVLLFILLFYKDNGHRTISFVEPPKTASITILWAEWKPADYLQILAHDFTRETGIEVTVVQRSWSDWQQHFISEMEQKSKRYDLVIGDSQWLGYGARNGHYIDLTKWIAKQQIEAQFVPTAMQGYAEYPKGSQRYWAIPAEGDAMGFAYRKDLFEDPHEQRLFQQRYGYPLKVPETWQQLSDIAQHFYRPDQHLWGIMNWVEPNYDGLTMALQSVLWAWGAELGNQQNHEVVGVLNTPEAAEALRFYKQLTSYTNPAWKEYYLDTDKSHNQPLISGEAAMAMVYFAITPELLNPVTNPYADKIGFFPTPAGPAGRATSLGGQGLSLISYSKKKEYALAFLEWFVQQETQQKWSDLGGLSCHVKILNSESFLQASPMHPAFSESFGFVQDFWAVPEYAQLLDLSQQHWDEYLNTDQLTAEQSLDRLAQQWDKVFEYGGYYKE
ncbi:ABC transporter substrate-binding protein [Amphritea balenae]|uniref:ABC transporter substrate-binding protein n=1 Tax=Amphritea balenae TaxID=452629 RepID=UPI001475DEE2|nr:extracellular solute-binding protein [Amphritea balenae]GGK73568.1 ABC transporter substrate-binding protein [Amphritea balenae]